MEENKQGSLKKVLGFWDLMGIGVGQIIGSGIMPDLQVEETIGTLRRGLDIPLISALSVLR